MLYRILTTVYVCLASPGDYGHACLGLLPRGCAAVVILTLLLNLSVKKGGLLIVTGSVADQRATYSASDSKKKKEKRNASQRNLVNKATDVRAG